MFWTAVMFALIVSLGLFTSVYVNYKAGNYISSHKKRIMLEMCCSDGYVVKKGER